MRIVVDTNILISFFRDNPVRQIIINSEFFNLELFTSEHGFNELANIKDLSKYSKLSSDEMDNVLEELKKYIKIIPDESSIRFKDQAKKLSPHDKDIPFFALALYFNCSIWSNELEFKNQSSIKIFNTKELREFIKFD